MHFRDHLKNIFVGLVIFPLSIFVFTPFAIFSMILYLYHFIKSLTSYESAYFFRKYSKSLAISVDQFANTVIYGNVDQTISGRMGIFMHVKKKNHIIITHLCTFLNLFFKDENHCKDAIEYDRIDLMKKDYNKDVHDLVDEDYDNYYLVFYGLVIVIGYFYGQDILGYFNEKR